MLSPFPRFLAAVLAALSLAACGGSNDAAGVAAALPAVATATTAKALAAGRDGVAPVRYVRLEATSEVNGNPWTSLAELNLLDAAGATIQRSGWSVAADSQETAGENAPAGHAIDGDPFTIWHTQWQGGTPPLPHTLTIDLGAPQAIGGFRYLPRQVGSNGRIAGWRLHVSADGSAWTLASQGVFANGSAEVTVLLAAVPPANQPPLLATPADRSDALGQPLSQALTASDADGDTLTYSASGLPPGLAVDAASGLIAGTPGTAGTFRPTVQVSDGRGGVATASFNWTVVAAGGDGGGTVARYVRLEALSEVAGNPWASVAELNILAPGGAASLPRGDWSISADSQETAGEDAPARYAIDGNPGSIWHTQWQGGSPAMPHALTIDFGAARAIGGFKYLPRQLGSNGRIAGWRFHASADALSWVLLAQGTFANGAAEQTVVFSGGASPPANQPPVLAAVPDLSGRVGEVASLALTGSDPDGDPLAYGASGLPAGLAINAATGVIAGTPTAAGAFAVTATVHDGRGGSASRGFGWTIGAAAAPATAVRHVRLEAVSEVNGNDWSSVAEFNVLDGAGVTIPRTGWTVSADSQETVGENAPARNAIDGDPNSFWHTQWQGGHPAPPHALTVDLGAPRVVGGFRYLPRQNGSNGRIAGWRFHTSADGVSWAQVAQGSFVDSAAEQGQLIGAAPPPAAPNPTRATRIAAFASGPLVAGPAWRAGEAVAVDAVRRVGGGQHLVYTAAGTTGNAEPVPGSSTALDGRPIADGSATAYLNGRALGATQPAAPVVGWAANAAAAGLGQTDFAAGDFQPARLSTVQGCRSISTGHSFIGHYCFANGPAGGSGNSTAIASGPYGAGLSADYVYHSNSWEEEFVVTDHRFGLVFANSASPVNVEIDGVQLQAAPTVSSGSPGWTLTIDYQGVVKRRTVRVVSAVGSVAPNLRGVALTMAGRVDAGTTSTDQLLIFGDSINATVTPPTEAGAQMMSYWVQRHLGFGGAINLAVGGSGYVSQNPGSFNLPNLLAAPVNRVLIAGYAPNVTHVIVGAGFNDRFRPVATVQAAALASWRTLRQLLPNARISITDGWSGSSGPDANALALAAGLAAAFAEWGDGNARLIRSVGTSAATAYVSGSGHAGVPVSAGNSSVYTSTDAVHPSPAGARHIARRLSDDIAAAWAGAY